MTRAPAPKIKHSAAWSARSNRVRHNVVSLFHLIGAGRSGTSVLTTLIDCHSQCCVDLERDMELLMGHIDTPAEAVPDLRIRTGMRIDNYLETWRSRAAQATVAFLGNKITTEQIDGLRKFRGEVVTSDIAPIAAFVERVADIPTVFIVRDGRACIASKIARTGQPLEMAILRWKFAVELQRMMERACKSLLVVKYEALVREPERELTRIGRFLGFDYEPGMLAGVNSEKLQPEYRREGFDVVEIATNPPWVDQIAPQLESLGYPVSLAPA